MKLLFFAACIAAQFSMARAGECPPDSLGTSRVMDVGARGGLEVGLKTYPRTLALADREVVLTFDDGPAAETTPRILDALAGECVRATFFLIGRNAEAMPHLVRRELSEGHTIGHHSYSHPAATLRYFGDAEARADILRGMAAVERAAYGDALGELGAGALHTPFFRFPGFADTPALRQWLAANSVGVFGADVWASDWTAMSPREELALTLARLERAGRGIILFHDTHEWTANMLPDFLRELKKRGYRVVHVVPATGSAATIEAPAGWTSETESIIGRLKQKLSSPAL